MQPMAPAAEYDPIEHTEQLEAPVFACDVPAVQLEQPLAAAAEYIPVTQTMQVDVEVAPTADDDVPAAQKTQVDELVVVW